MRLLAAGRDCDVFDVGDGTVLRRTKNGRSLEGEAAVMAHARDHGYPCPRVHRAEGPDLVLDLVPGPTMLDDLLADLTPAKGAAFGATLGDLHDQLHRIPGLHADTLLHLDLHPGNVILSPDGPVVIDWTNAEDGDAGLDLAITWVTLVPFEPVAPDVVAALVDGLLAGPRRASARSQLAEAGRRRLADRNLSDDEKAAIADFVNANG